MHIGVIGMNHKSSPLAIREMLATAVERLKTQNDHFKQGVVLFSTCNRSEVYFASKDPSQTHSAVINMLRENIKIPFEHLLYSYFGRECFLHLIRVVSGLDSALVGECDIVRQVKHAYNSSCDRLRLHKELHYIFQKSFQVSKRLRRRFTMHRWSMDLSDIVWTKCREKGVQRVLFVGFSDINRKIMAYFSQRGMGDFAVMTRADPREVPYRCISWNAAIDYNSFDCIIFGTKHPSYVLEGALSLEHALLILDLSVPRNVDPSLKEHPYVTLYNIEELSGAVAQHRERSAAEIMLCEQSAEHFVDRQTALYYRHEMPKIIPFSKVV